MSARRVAVDLGASTGRVAVGELVDGRLEFEVIHRFPNHPVQTKESLLWNYEGLVEKIFDGIKRAGLQGDVASIGVDSWAVDFGVVAEDGDLTVTPVCYRDSRTDGVLEELTAAERTRIADLTGLQFLPFNTLFQIKRSSEDDFVEGNHLLMIPDLIHHGLTGIPATESTNASTTQLFDPVTRRWIPDLASWCGIPLSCLPEIREAGDRLGRLHSGWHQFPGLKNTEVILPATHDTASAVLAVPMEDISRCAYVSSGTWSLVGVELPGPLMKGSLGWSNESGAFGTTRLLKNMAGLWILQESARSWGITDWDALVQSSLPFLATAKTFDPDLPKFLAPGMDVPHRVVDEIGECSQPELTASILVSLARKTAKLIGEVSEVTGLPIDTIHIVGGGSQNAVLNQLIADMSGLKVVAGPVEATLMGNLLMQFHAAGELGDDTIRNVVRRSALLEVFEPTL